MKYRRSQTVGNIQFIVESNFKNSNADTAKEKLSKVMISKAKETLRSINKFKQTIPQN